ncbi:hypothetical protein BV22DRAFT_837136 [Leucogyrophana mollusca]|uniref:Uncharacterized protein n=1 Tax=Leucogyrophana mollusca TaxID=85980 RepID=A0ACB8B2Q4_9AGAM|nr:hypothetical protein BV22DRAFT_837136 [Leucogyrophana mollusca]
MPSQPNTHTGPNHAHTHTGPNHAHTHTGPNHAPTHTNPNRVHTHLTPLARTKTFPSPIPRHTSFLQHQASPHPRASPPLRRMRMHERGLEGRREGKRRRAGWIGTGAGGRSSWMC